MSLSKRNASRRVFQKGSENPSKKSLNQEKDNAKRRTEHRISKINSIS